MRPESDLGSLQAHKEKQSKEHQIIIKTMSLTNNTFHLAILFRFAYKWKLHVHANKP